MKTLRYSLNTIAGLLMALGISVPANAQATRTWVSGVGDDVNPCSRTAPCKTFAGAISKTAASGEINCLDPGGFGTLTITKSITVDCAGTLGSSLASNTTGFIINANAASDVVILRNLSINGAGTGIRGINFLAAKTLHVENVSIYKFTGNCIEMNVSANSQLTVDNSTLSECLGGVQIGTTGAFTAVANITNVRINKTQNGVSPRNGARVVISDSSLAFNTVGVGQVGPLTFGSAAMITNSTMSLNGTALQSIGAGTIAAFGNTFGNNGTIYNPNGGTISTGNDNAASGNGATGIANGGVIPKV